MIIILILSYEKTIPIKEGKINKIKFKMKIKGVEIICKIKRKDSDRVIVNLNLYI